MLKPSWRGQRVSVRRAVGRDSDGRIQFSDVVGDLLSLDETHAVIDSRSGPVEIDLQSIAVAKIVPPSTADELALEAVAARGWRPAESEWLGGWLLRASGGFTGRANSVLPLRQLDRPLDEALDAAQAWYAARNLPLVLQIPTESRRLLDAELGERGWAHSADVHVMTARLEFLSRGSEGVEITSAPDDDWLAARARSGASSPDAQALLTRHDNVGFAAVRRDGATIAVGRGTVDTDERGTAWLGIFSVEVNPRLRRQGLARAVMAALHEWGAERGAARAYLQVESTNAGAVALYEKLGYHVHHDYRYRYSPT